MGDMGDMEDMEDMEHSRRFRSNHVQSHPKSSHIRLECPRPFDSMESMVLQPVLALPVEHATSEAYESLVC